MRELRFMSVHFIFITTLMDDGIRNEQKQWKQNQLL